MKGMVLDGKLKHHCYEEHVVPCTDGFELVFKAGAPLCFWYEIICIVPFSILYYNIILVLLKHMVLHKCLLLNKTKSLIYILRVCPLHITHVLPIWSYLGTSCLVDDRVFFNHKSMGYLIFWEPHHSNCNTRNMFGLKPKV